MEENSEKRPRRTIDEFLNTISEDSRVNYKSVLVGESGFFTFIGIDPNKYLFMNRDYEKDVED